MAAPMAALEPSAEPLAVVVPAPWCVAVAPRVAATVAALAVAPPWIDPSVRVVETLRANDPATPVFPPLAPDVAFAANRCVVSPPTFVIPADAVRPSPATLAPAAMTA